MNYFSTFVPGIQELVQSETEDKIKDVHIDSLLNGIIIFEAEDQAEKIKNLPIIDDNFILIRKFEGLPKNPLRLITRLLTKEEIPSLLLKEIEASDFKILVNVSGKFLFDRKDLGRELERILVSKWKLKSNAQSKNEFWFFLRGRLGLFGFKITDKKFKYRAYKVKNIPGSLRPQIAYAMCLISKPDKEDVFLDPMCGVGTILIERALNFPFKLIFGGDIDEESVGFARENIKEARVRVKVQRWDATWLKEMKTNSVDKLVTNPPWGRTLDRKLDYNVFYPKLLLEFRRVLKQDGILVLLTSEKSLFEKLIRDNRKHFCLEQQFNIFVSGQKAGIYKLRKR